MAHWLVFAGLGPVFGTGVLVSFLLYDITLDGREVDWMLLFGTLAKFVLPLSYIVGLPLALAVCFVVRRLQFHKTPHEIAWVSGIGLIAGILFSGFFMARGGYSGPFAIITEYGRLTLAGFVATLACWHISKRLARRAEMSHV